VKPFPLTRALGFPSPLAPDSEAVLRGVEMELCWRGARTVSLTPDEYVFRGPGLGGTLLPQGGSTTWLVRGGTVSWTGQHALQVKLDLNPVPLFLVPLAAAAALVLLPLGLAERAIGLLAGAGLWYHAWNSAWKSYREWIWAGALQPWYTGGKP
jgi:hypothetical protein